MSAERAGPLLSGEVKPLLDTRWIGRPIHFHRTVTSTNDLLLDGAFVRYGPGTVIASEEQTKGRGRRGRAWVAPPFRALQFSVLLREEPDPQRAATTTLAAGVAVAGAVREAAGVDLRVRWPNDLVSGGRKACGILSEYRTATRSLVIGIGLNVNQTGDEMPPVGTSLIVEGGHEIPRGPLLAAILGRLEEWIDRLDSEGFEPVRREAQNLSSLVGKRVTLDVGSAEVTGLSTGVGPAGGLLIRTRGGEREYRSGEVVRVLSREGGGAS